MTRAILWLTGVAVAGFVGVASSAIVHQAKRPATSYMLGVGPLGTAQGNLAFASYAARVQSNPRAQVTARERELAAAAYRSEPLSSSALGLLILSRDGNDPARRSLLDIGGKLTRRSSLITAASIDAAARSGDEGAFFRWLSRAILTNESMRATYIRAMAQATARPGAVATLAPVLGPKPSWSDRYWGYVAAMPESLENAVKLRLLLAGAPWRQTEVTATDRNLALALTKRRQFDTVQQLASGLQRVSSRRTAQHNLLTNGNFDQPSQMPPIDWELASEGNLGASINVRAKKLIISPIAGAHGYAARQLVRLEPGRYDLSWTLASNSRIGPDELVAHLSCAERQEKGGMPPVELAVGSHSKVVEVPQTPCRWYQLSIDADLPDMGSGFDAELRTIRLTPASANRLSG
ncbi:hypothetical protein [Sphingopyxis sp. JAI128]|uniref:hypothetical protein n=1 Tax=Sphingopyxis sp. JAI128 TaxID=2723066 RepID=UPI001615FF98|nr:hypothetical protein [Sphingopyxis sp. JAI128]MBB6424396.1 hypothetical protein [Sphingopyxis sp. JAI128]